MATALADRVQLAVALGAAALASLLPAAVLGMAVAAVCIAAIWEVLATVRRVFRQTTRLTSVLGLPFTLLGALARAAGRLALRLGLGLAGCVLVGGLLGGLAALALAAVRGLLFDDLGPWRHHLVGDAVALFPRTAVAVLAGSAAWAATGPGERAGGWLTALAGARHRGRPVAAAVVAALAVIAALSAAPHPHWPWSSGAAAGDALVGTLGPVGRRVRQTTARATIEGARRALSCVAPQVPAGRSTIRVEPAGVGQRLVVVADWPVLAAAAGATSSGPAARAAGLEVELGAVQLAGLLLRSGIGTTSLQLVVVDVAADGGKAVRAELAAARPIVPLADEVATGSAVVGLVRASRLDLARLQGEPSLREALSRKPAAGC